MFIRASVTVSGSNAGQAQVRGVYIYSKPPCNCVFIMDDDIFDTSGPSYWVSASFTGGPCYARSHAKGKKKKKKQKGKERPRNIARRVKDNHLAAVFPGLGSCQLKHMYLHCIY